MNGGGGGWALTSAELLALIAAIGHPHRFRMIAELSGGRVHVSELARRLGMTRSLVYLHLERLESAGLVTGPLERSSNGTVMNMIELVPFELNLTVDAVRNAVHADDAATPTRKGRHDVNGTAP